MATWPSGLPQELNRKGFRSQLPEQLVRSSIPEGRPRARRRARREQHAPFSGTMTLTTAEWNSLLDWYTKTLADGTLAFKFPDPDDPTSTITVSFDEPPRLDQSAGDSHRVRMALSPASIGAILMALAIKLNGTKVGDDADSLDFTGSVKVTGTGDEKTISIAVHGLADKSADYTMVAGDRGKTLVYSGSAAATFTLPDITGDVATGWDVWVLNGSTYDLTLDGNGSDLIDGGATYIVPAGSSANLVAVTTNSWAVRHAPQKLWTGKRRILSGNPAGAQGSWVNALRTTITPLSTTAAVRVRGHFLAGIGVTSSDDRFCVLAIRRKIGSGGSWTGLYGGGNFTVLDMQFQKASSYFDWAATTADFDVEFVPGSTSEVTIEIGAFAVEGHSIVSDVDVFFNRAGAGAGNWLTNAEKKSMVEVAQLARSGAIVETTVTARDT